MKTNRLAAAASTAVLSLGVLVACSPDQSTAPARVNIAPVVFDIVGNANAGQLEVCKQGTAATFTVTFGGNFVAGQVTGGITPAGGNAYTFGLTAGQCLTIYSRPVVAGVTLDPDVNATVVETAPVGGITFVSVSTTTESGNPQSTNQGARSGTVTWNMFHDARVTFVNNPAPPAEPPVCDFSTFGGFTLERNYNISYGGNAGRADNGLAYGDLNFVNHTTGDHIHVWNVTGYVHPTTGPLTGAGYEDSRMATGMGEINGAGSFPVEWRFIDKGEPGTKDEVYLKVNGVVLIQQQSVQGGNVQLHSNCKPAPKDEKH
jgi:hypothetical protein